MASEEEQKQPLQLKKKKNNKKKIFTRQVKLEEYENQTIGIRGPEKCQMKETVVELSAMAGTV